MRPADDTHWGKSMSGLRFNEDGGFYLAAWQDFMGIAGHAPVNFLRGPFFSGMVKHNQIAKGIFDLSKLSLEERGERMFLGAAVPCVRSLNGRPKPENRMDQGGMSAPLRRMVQQLSVRTHEKVSALVKRELPRPDMPMLKAKLAKLQAPRFDAAAARQELHGEYEAEIVVPKQPRAGWSESEQERWYAREMPPPRPRCVFGP